VYDSSTDALLKKERLGTDLYQYHEEQIQYPSPTPEPTPSPTPQNDYWAYPTVTPSPEESYYGQYQVGKVIEDTWVNSKAG